LLFSKIDLSSDIEKVYNIILTCIELCENKTILELIINDEKLVTLLLEVLAFNASSLNSDQEYNYTEVLILLINILKLISIENLKVPGYVISNEEDIVNSDGNNKTFENTKFGELLLKYLPQVLVNFPMESNANVIDGTFGMTFHPLGLRRVRMVELVFCCWNYFKNVPELIDGVILETQFFKYLLVRFF
jgi:hypothetical protein